MAKMTDKQYEDLGKKLMAFYESGYVNKKQALSWSFLKGLAGGFGAFLGGTILIGLLLWILSLFDQVPFIDAVRDLLTR
jgi:hypothetical protein